RARARSRTASSSSFRDRSRVDVTTAFLERWLEGVVASPGGGGPPDPADARRVLLDDALRARAILEQLAGPVVDVGSGGGTPGIPLAVAFPERRFVLLDAE